MATTIFIHSLISNYLNPYSYLQLSVSLIIIIIIIIITSIIFQYLKSSSSCYGHEKKDTSSSPPIVDGAWPIIGHLHLLRGPKPLHRVLGDMADKYGPIFILQMGRTHQRAIVVSDWEIAKECLTANDKVFMVNRLQTRATEILGYDGAMFGFSPYGHFWRQIRKLVTLELLSSHRLRLLKPVRESEIRVATKELYDLWCRSRERVVANNKDDAVSVEMMSWFGDVALNAILRLVFGKRVGYYNNNNCRDEGESGKLKKLVRDYFDSTEKFGVGDVLPWLRWLDIEGHEKALKKTAKELDEVVLEWLREHKQKSSSDDHDNIIGGDDFMGLLLNVLDDYDIAEERKDVMVVQGHDSDTINKATCLALTLGASDSTTVAMSWALSLLINHPEALRKVQIELDEVVGKERQVQESDLHDLQYLQAVVKETLRLYPPVPVNMRGGSGDDCVVAGHHVPKGTQLVLNYFKLHRDPCVWVDPHQFRPERFLVTHKNMDVKGQDFELLPFGSGRRMCPGVSFALHVVQLTLAMLLQGFHFQTETFGGVVDMGEKIGSTYQRATPLQVLLFPRLAAHLYG